MIKKLSSTEVHEHVRRRYAEISCSIHDRFKYPTGREGVLMLGYDMPAAEIVPEGIVASFCGVGNPFRLGPVHHGDTVLDVGCGGGFDVLVATHYTGSEGRVYGIDLVPEMAEKADRNIRSMGLSTCEIRVAGSEALPFDDHTFDIIISNGAIYLSPLKEKSMREVFRVLKPGGRFQFADVVLKDDLPDKVVACFDGWSGWIGDAVPVRDLVELMRDTGFDQAEFAGLTGVLTSKFTAGAHFRARKRNLK